MASSVGRERQACDSSDLQYNRGSTLNHHGMTMRSFIETGAIITACGSAAFWFLSAMCRLPHIKRGMDEPDNVTELSKALQRMNRWNFCAAGLMGVTALLAALARYLG